VKGYFYMFGAWLMHLFMIQIKVQVDVWYKLEQVVGTCCLVHVYWYRFTPVYLTVIV
jgi:hypothetical protein